MTSSSNTHMSELEIRDPVTGVVIGLNFTETYKHLFGPDRPISERQFVEAYSHLRDNRSELSRLAMKYYREARGLEALIPGVNLLGRKSWIPHELIDLN